MSSKNLKVTLTSDGPRQLRLSPGVCADLLERGERVAAAAGEGHSVQLTRGANRARVVVRTDTFAARAAEAKDRNLTRAVDAAR